MRQPTSVGVRAPRNNTGVTGIHYVRAARAKRAPVHRYFVVTREKTRGSRRFNIDTLGKEEAWRRALRCRAEFEAARRAAIEKFSAQRGNPAPGFRGTIQNTQYV